MHRIALLRRHTLDDQGLELSIPGDRCGREHSDDRLAQADEAAQRGARRLAVA
jgi:hypothetical protein